MCGCMDMKASGLAKRFVLFLFVNLYTMEDKIPLRSMRAVRFCLCMFSNVSNISTSFFLEVKVLQGICCFIRSFVGFYFDRWVRLRLGGVLEGVFDY